MVGGLIRDMANFVNGIIENESINTRSNKQQSCP